MTSMHILLDARLLRRETGGIGRYSQALMRWLSDVPTRHRFSALMTEADRGDWQRLVATHPHLRNWLVRFDGPAHYTVAEQVVLPKILRSLRPDLVHFLNTNHPITYHWPFVVTIHDLTILKYPVGSRQRSFLMQAAYRWVLRHAVTKSRRILTVSDTTKQDIRRMFQAEPERIVVTPEGVDEDYQPVSLPQRGRVQRHIQEVLGVRAPYFLFVSQWRPHKGILTLVQAYEELCQRLAKRNPRARVPQLVIAGKPHPAYPEIPRRIAQSPFVEHISTPGFVDEEVLPALYQGADAFLFPSEYEGFGLTPLEAMASGTPVLASNTSSLPEVIGKAGVLLDPHAPAVWVDAMEKILGDRDLWRKLRSAGMVQARRFSWQTMAQETLAAYEACLASATP
ncbi:glycosyltransferase family 4 protein [Candidatus Berkelbacteria bacterium]|nr:glycosyltransferase family 4 protein [Candidatus Berkelbacteria bacterium]